MYTQYQEGFSILLLTSILLQSCGGNVFLAEYRPSTVKPSRSIDRHQLMPAEAASEPLQAPLAPTPVDREPMDATAAVAGASRQGAATLSTELISRPSQPSPLKRPTGPNLRQLHRSAPSLRSVQWATPSRSPTTSKELLRTMPQGTPLPQRHPPHNASQPPDSLDKTSIRPTPRPMQQIEAHTFKPGVGQNIGFKPQEGLRSATTQRLTTAPPGPSRRIHPPLQALFRIPTSNRTASKTAVLKPNPLFAKAPQCAVLETSNPTLAGKPAQAFMTDPEPPVFTTARGQQVSFHWEGQQWQAQVSEQLGPCSRTMRVPVVYDAHTDPGILITTLQTYPCRAAQWLHLLPTRGVVPYHPWVVHVGPLGLLGGMRSALEESKTATKRHATTQLSNQASATPQAPSFRMTTTPLDASTARQWLKTHYQERFAYVPALFDDDPPQPMEEVRYNLVLYNNKDKAQDGVIAPRSRSFLGKTSILGRATVTLSELFQEDSPVQKSKKILLLGETGIGKTLITHHVAYSWSQGQLGKQFETVYLLPARELQQARYNGSGLRREATLSTAIANHCFPHLSDDSQYIQLRLRIAEDLQNKSTLVILDGLEDRDGASARLLTEAQQVCCRLLLLADPARLGSSYPSVDMQLGIEGLSSVQVGQYVRRYFDNPEQGESLQQFLQTHPALCAFTHVPINLRLLCNVWRADAAGVREEVREGSLTGLYRKLSAHVWAQHARSKGVERPKSKDRKKLYNALGPIALRALEKGEVHLSTETVHQVLAELPTNKGTEAILAGSALLRATERGYQFPHPTFCTYFAARELARLFRSTEAQDQTRLSHLLSRHKYQAHYQPAIRFMAGELVKSEGLPGLRALMRRLDQEPREIIGVQHALLQRRCLQEWQLQGQEREEEVAALEAEFDLISPLTAWQQHALLATEQQGFQRDIDVLLAVAMLTPGQLSVHKHEVWALLQKVFEEGRTIGARTAATEVLHEWVRVAPSLASEVLPLLQRAVFYPGEYGIFDACCLAAVRALGGLVEVAPELSHEVLYTLESWVSRLGALRQELKDKDWLLFESCIESLGKLVKAAPFYSDGALVLLRQIFETQDAMTRLRTVEALGELLKASPRLTPEVVPLFQRALEEKYPMHDMVQRKVYEIVDREVKRRPELAEEFFDMFQRVFAHPAVSCSWTMENIEKLIKVSPRLAPRALPLLQADSCSPHYRSYAPRVLLDLAQVSPTHAQQAVALFLLYQLSNVGVFKSDFCKAIHALLDRVPQNWPRVSWLLQHIALHPDVRLRFAATNELMQLAGIVYEEDSEELRALGRGLRSKRVFELHLNEFLEGGRMLHRMTRAAREGLTRDAFSKTSAFSTALFPFWRHAARGPEGNIYRSAIDALSSSLAASPAYALSTFPLLREAIQNEDKEVRIAAIYALGKTVKVTSELVPDSLSLLQEVLQGVDVDTQVRQAAIGTLGTLMQVDPDSASASLPFLQEALQDTDPALLQAAISALGKMGEVAPQHAPAAFLLIQAAMQSASEALRSTTDEVPRIFAQSSSHGLGRRLTITCIPKLQACIFALERLVKTNPLLVPKVLPLLQRTLADLEALRQTILKASAGSRQASSRSLEEREERLYDVVDSNYYYLLNAITEVLESIMELSPERSPALLPLFRDALQPLDKLGVYSGDTSSSDRVELLYRLVKAAPEHAHILLPLLRAGLNKGKYEVINPTIEVLTFIAREVPALAPEVLHTYQGLRGRSAYYCGRLIDDVDIYLFEEIIKASPELASDVLPYLLAALKSEYKDCRRPALAVLSRLTAGIPTTQAEPLLRSLLTLMNTDSSKIGDFGIYDFFRYSTSQQLLDYYWLIRDEALIPFLAPKLYHTPILIEQGRQADHQQLILYPTSGPRVIWERPQEEVEIFLQHIQEALRDDEEWLSQRPKGSLEQRYEFY